MKITLTDRKKLLIWAGGAVLALLLVFQLAVGPFLESKDHLRKGIIAKQRAIPEMLRIESQYQAANHGAADVAQQVAKQPKDFALFPFLEKNAKEAGVIELVSYMKPMTASTTGAGLGESLVEMKLEGVSLQQLLGYIAKIEVPAQGITIKRISIQQESKADSMLDVIVQVAAATGK